MEVRKSESRERQKEIRCVVAPLREIFALKKPLSKKLRGCIFCGCLKLYYQQSIAITKETVFVFNGFFVCFNG